MAESNQKVEATTPVNVSEFIVQWDTFHKTYDNRTLTNNIFIPLVAKKMGITDEMASQLNDVCQLSSLTCDGEPKGIFPGISPENDWKEVPPHVTNLTTLNLHREELKRRQSRNYRIRNIRRLKHKMVDLPWLHEIKNRLHRDEQLSVPNDVILTVQVFMPYFPGRNKPLQLSQEIHVLGQQQLSALRDKIECTLDNQVLGEFSCQPDFPKDNLAKEVYPSGFFFFENVFYNDMRWGYSRDLSKPIIDWAAKGERGIGPYETGAMESTTFDQLTIKLGHPYLYQHQGKCEHIIIFSDIRIVHPEDCLKVEDYPLVVSKYRPASKKCKVCIHNWAVWMTRSSPFAPEDPCFFCDTCFRMLHYDEEGQKLGEFTAYPCP